jgi:prepilin-type N-terminal cleavage/methylation domain-containing protein
MKKALQIQPLSQRAVPPRIAAGYTLIELLVVIGIIATLGAMVVGASWQHLRNKAELATCSQQLKGFHVCLQSYMQDHEGSWPQITDEELGQLGDSESDMWKWWLDRLKKHGASPKMFMCPTDERERGARSEENPREEFESSYVFPFFDSGASTPFLWAQPWVMERSIFHDKGIMEIMPDGQIRPNPYFR